MKIKIKTRSGTVNLDVEQYYDSYTIIKKYAYTYGDKHALARYYRIVQDEPVITPDLELTISDIRNVIRKHKNVDGANGFDYFVALPNMNLVLLSYPEITAKEIVLLWLIERYLPEGVTPETESHLALSIEGEGVLDKVRQIPGLSFITADTLKDNVIAYYNNLDSERQALIDDVKHMDSVYEIITKEERYNTSDVVLDEVTFLIFINLPNNENLEHIFDAMTVSESIPFIMLNYRDTRRYKVDKHMPIFKSWIDFEPETEGIFFKILNAEPTKLQTSKNIQRFFSDGVWHVDSNIVEIEYVLNTGITSEIIKNRFEGCITGNIDYGIYQSNQTSVKARFTVDDFDFNRVIFTDLVYLSDVFSYFLFFNERNRSSVEKPRYFFYYRPGHDFDVRRSMKITFTQQKFKNVRKVEIKVSRAKNKQQVESFRILFSQLVSLYNKNIYTTLAVYKKYIANAMKYIDVYSLFRKQTKKNIKTGERLEELQERRPDIFVANYSRICSKDKQPYLIEGEQTMHEILEVLDNNEHKIINYPLGSTDYYACEPREDDDDKHNWPGLQKNDKLSNKKEYPLIPCCFTKDQYAKKSSNLNTYIKKQEDLTGINTAQLLLNAGDPGHVLKPNKVVTPGRYGELPYYISTIVTQAGIKPITKGKSTYLPILRTGVMQTPDSFFHCLERAFNPKYYLSQPRTQRDIVAAARQQMANYPSFAIAKQELYDYTDDEVRHALLDSERFIDPGMWIKLAEKHYNCNILMYRVDDENPNGAIAIPRHSQVYLTRDIPLDRNTVLIVSYQIDGKDYPYQCELLCRWNLNINTTKNFEYYFNSRDKLIETAIKFFFDSNRIYMLDIENIPNKTQYGTTVITKKATCYSCHPSTM